MSYLAILFIRIYQKTISPFLPGSCRHYPTCSHYGIESFKVHGFLMGLYLTIKRILKCNPFFDGGFDPVPPKQFTQNLKHSGLSEKI
ncbi:MAG: membrane protein insertion efficiency factor YidD [Ignavibacteria bacterium]